MAFQLSKLSTADLSVRRMGLKPDILTYKLKSIDLFFSTPI